MTPQRIALIGNGGAGKSTAAKRLSRVSRLPLYIVDDVQFLPGWERRDVAEVALWHQQVMAGSAWIIDGWGSWDLIDRRFAKADLILFFDYPFEEHLRIARMREIESSKGTCAYEPPGCRYADVGPLMEDTLIRVDRELLPLLRDRLSRIACEVVNVRAIEELEPVIADLEARFRLDAVT